LILVEIPAHRFCLRAGPAAAARQLAAGTLRWAVRGGHLAVGTLRWARCMTGGHLAWRAS